MASILRIVHTLQAEVDMVVPDAGSGFSHALRLIQNERMKDCLRGVLQLGANRVHVEIISSTEPLLEGYPNDRKEFLYSEERDFLTFVNEIGVYLEERDERKNITKLILWTSVVGEQISYPAAIDASIGQEVVGKPLTIPSESSVQSRFEREDLV